MKRLTSVLIAVILGAFATGIGTVPFLVLANADRNRLGNELHQTKAVAAATENEKKKIADEANKKVQAANEEVQKAQAIILETQEDERLLADSERLASPTIRERAKWNPVISLYQGISLSLPSGYTVTDDQPTRFAISQELRSATSSDESAIMIQPYDDQKEVEYLNSFASSTDISYVAGGRLLKGKQGILLDGSAAMALEVRYSAKTTHLIWMRDPSGSFIGLKQILATIEYR
jgi:hypothetical protein